MNFKIGDKVFLKDVFQNEDIDFYKKWNKKELTIKGVKHGNEHPYMTKEAICGIYMWGENELEPIRGVNEL